jgi:hypothetical protein
MIDSIINFKQLKNYITAPTSEKIAVCKVTRKGTFDYKNEGGTLTRILKNRGVDIQDVFEYFDIVDNPLFSKENPIKCQECTFSCKTNRDGSLTRHLRIEHKITPEQYLKNHPTEGIHFSEYKKNIERELLFKESDNNYIICPLCKVKLKKITGSHIQYIHKMTPEEFFMQTGVVNRSSEATLEKKRANYFTYNQNVDSKMNKPSKDEQEVRDYIQELLPTADLSKKKYLPGVEIDIYIEDLRVGVEYNGLYYHAEKSMGRGRKYHLNKTQLAEKHNIHLIQIFSDEWKHKKDIIKAKLKHILKCGDTTVVYARQCKIQEISPKIKKEFLEKYHIQGSSNSSYNYGAFYNGELVGVATFSKPRIATGTWKDVEGKLELTRFCIASEVSIVGILPRFLKRVMQDVPNLKTIYSYADRRYTNKYRNVYEKVGFQYVGETPPSYWYTKYQEKRYHRYTFTKHKLKKLKVYEEGLTEWQIMQNLKFDRVWDCGNLKYEWTPIY